MGQAALAAGNFRDGVFWLERAERMARQSPNVTWALGMAFLAAGRPGGCLARMRFLRERFHLREAFFVETICLTRLGQADKAAAAMQTALSILHATPEIYGLAQQLARHADRPGWVTASNDGYVLVQAEKLFRIFLDGQLVASGQSGRYPMPEGWRTARRLEICAGNRHLLGSPIDITALTRCESLVSPQADGLHGWIWTPAEPDHVPVITLWNGQTLRADSFAEAVDSDVPLARPRRFHIPRSVLPDHDCGPLAVRDENGNLLTGAPLDPLLGLLLAGRTRTLPKRFKPVRVRSWKTRPARPRSSPGCAIVIPVYGNTARTQACLKSVLTTCPPDVRVVVVDDATPDASLGRLLDRLSADDAITMVRHPHNQGFVASVNDGMRMVGGQDVILLNSDTLVPPGWVERLRQRLERSDVGTVTPFSNEATILSYPSVEKTNPVPGLQETRRLDRRCAGLFGQEQPEIDLPTAHGFCMAISAECLAETGLFREDVFAQGYGEENDFCLRASALGFRHLAAPELYVAHVGGISFGSSGKALAARNLEFVNALHPGYSQLVARFIQRDPLGTVRRQLDLAGLQSLRGKRLSLLMIQHDAGGGVGRVVRDRAAAFERDGQLALLLKPTSEGCRLETALESDRFPNLKFALPEEFPLFVETLRVLRVSSVEWHHLVGHAPCIRTLHEALDVPYDVFIHDHVWFCPRISLCNGEGRYCGEPEPAVCQTCVDRWGGFLGEDLTVLELLERSRRELGQARTLMAPTQDTARRIRRHFPGLGIMVIPLQNDAALLETLSSGSALRNGAPLRICIVGGISEWKGYDVLKAMALEIQFHGLPVELVLVGHTRDDETLIEAGVRVTGEYQEADALSLIREQNAHVGLIPSIAPETWCYVLGLLWQSGLEAVCFDLGAQGERVRKAGAGAVIPLGMPVPLVLAFFLRRWAH